MFGELPSRIRQRSKGGWFCAGAILAPFFFVGCATPVIEVAPDEDFSGYETWGWLPRLDASDTDLHERSELRDGIRRQVERSLADLGYRRATGRGPDFYVTYHLELRSEMIVRRETPPEQNLESFQQEGSFDVTRTTTHLARYETATLAIDVAEGRERQLVWRGRLEKRVRGSFEPHVEGVVAAVLERFPARPSLD